MWNGGQRQVEIDLFVRCIENRVNFSSGMVIDAGASEFYFTVLKFLIFVIFCA
jgi:hypothetical protein